MTDETAVTTCGSIRMRNTEDRWNRDAVLRILGPSWSVQDGSVEVNRNPVAAGRILPMVHPEVEVGPTATKSRNEDNGRRIHEIVPEFGATR